MAVPYSGGTYVNTTFTGDTKANIITALQTQLTTAGWTVVSGGGTTNLLMQTAAGGNGNQIRVRFRDNGGNCVQVTLENGAVAGMRSAAATTSTNSGGQLFPTTGRIYRILASKYRFEVFQMGIPVGRDFVAAGILYIPAPYTSVILEAAYMLCNCNSDSSGQSDSPRTSVMSGLANGVYGAASNYNVIYNGILVELIATNSSTTSCPTFLIPQNTKVGTYDTGDYIGYGSMNLVRWADYSVDSSDVLMAFGVNGNYDIPLIRGQMYDWVYIAWPYPGDSTDSWTDQSATHNYYNLTCYHTGTQGRAPGGFWVAYS